MLDIRGENSASSQEAAMEEARGEGERDRQTA